MDEYFDQSLKDLHTISKSARFENGYILEAKFGEITFELPGPGKRFILHFKRQNGNGKIEISFADQKKSISIISKISQIINLDYEFSNSLSVTISRPKDSIGEINILGISIDNPEINEHNKNKWKHIFAKCSDYQGIKILGNKLIAGEGAYIAPASIVSSITTNPHNATVVKNDRLNFLTKTEILGIEFQSTELFQHLFIPRNGPNPVFPQYNSPVMPVNSYLPVIPVNQSNNNIEIIEAATSRLIFDSDSVNGLFNKFVIRSNKLVKTINSNAKDYLVIKSQGEFIMPFSVLKPNSNYIIIIKLKKLSGNGKVRVGLINQAHSHYQIMIASSNFEEQSINLKTGNRAFPDENFKLSLKLEDLGTGEILINKIAIFEGYKLPSENNIITYDTSAPVLTTNFSIKDSARKAATIFVESYNKKFSFPYILEPLTYSARRWVANLAGLTSDLKVKDDDNLVVGAEKTNNIPHLVLGKLGEIKPCERIFLEEWGYQEPSNIDIAILQQCKTIITPSIKNLFVLKQKCPNSKLILGMKPWILPEEYSCFESGYFVYFEKNENITYALIKNWQTYFPTLYVVGSNLDVPIHIKKFSEYQSYGNLIKLLSNSLACLDFSLNSQYNSGIIDMAFNLGCEIITNNTYNMNDHYHYVNLDFNQNMIDLNFSKLSAVINKSLTKRNINNLYNDKVRITLEKLVTA